MNKLVKMNINELEYIIDVYTEKLPEIKTFILPRN